MKRTLLVLFFAFVTSVCFSQSKHPYYGGGHHTKSHGGYYRGGSGSSHRGGHYTNPKTVNTYGRHKRH